MQIRNDEGGIQCMWEKVMRDKREEILTFTEMERNCARKNLIKKFYLND